MDEIRRQLAELMDSVDTSSSSRKSFTDANVCKYYLTGLCPHDLFQNTKQYLGECSNVHSEDLREQYMEARKKANYGYEEMTMRCLKPHVDDCDRRIARQTLGGRCDTQDKASESIEASAKREVDALEAQIAQKMKEAEELGNSGDVEGSMKAMDEVNQLNMKKKHALEEKSSKVEEAKNMYFQKLRPCEACGALLSEKDGENRLNEHFVGRIHLGFEAIRKHVKELDEYLVNVASKLQRDSAYNCRPSSSTMPIRSDSMEDHRSSHRRRSVDEQNNTVPSHQRSNHHPYHRDHENGGGGHYGGRYGGREDSYRRESPSHRHYREDYSNRRHDDRYKQSSRYHQSGRYNGARREDQDDHRRDRYQQQQYRSSRDHHRRDSWRDQEGSEGQAGGDEGMIAAEVVVKNGDVKSDERVVKDERGVKDEGRHSVDSRRDSGREDRRSRSRERSSREERRRNDRSRSTSQRRPPGQQSREKRSTSRRVESDEEEGQIDQK